MRLASGAFRCGRHGDRRRMSLRRLGGSWAKRVIMFKIVNLEQYGNADDRSMAGG
jgi:hypothetical protein